MTKTYKINGEWVGLTAGGCLNHVHWRFNPQVFLKVKERRVVKIKLIQASDTKFYHIGFYVAKVDPTYGQRRQLQLIKDQLVCKAGFEAKKDVGAEVTLEPNEEYFVVPCTFRPREEGKFSCYFTVDGELQIRSLVPENEWKFVELSGEWSGITAGGCRNNPSCSKNPQFLIKTSNKPTETTVIIHQEAKEQFDMIGFYLLKTADKDHKVDKLPSSDMLAKTPFSSSREASARATLPPNGMFALVSSTFDPGKESQFDVVLFSDEPIKLKELTDRSTIALQGEWRDITAGGSVSSHTWRNNPQYFILAHQKCVVNITLTQNVFIDKLVHPIGFYVAKSSANQELGHRLLIWKQEEVLYKPTFEMKRSVTTKLALERSSTPYVVIPCTIKPALQKEFTLSVTLLEPPDLTNPKEIISVLPCNYTWQLKSLRGRWKGDQAAGSRTNSQLGHNPQYSLKIESPCTVVVILVVRQKDLVTVLCLLRAKDNELVRDIKDDMILERSSSNTEETYITRELTKGYYNIIPALSDPGKEALFEVLVYASVEDIEFTHAGSPAARTAAGPTVGPKPPTPMSVPRPVPQTSTSSSPSLAGAVASGSPALPDMAKHSSSPSLLSGEDSLARWLVDLTDLEFFEKIGQGGYGAVFRGALKHKGSNDKREVAIKKLIFRDEDEAKEFKKEVLLMSKLMHPKIVAFIGVTTDGNEMCILTEFCSRGNVTTILKTTPDLSWTIKLRMATDSAKGMLYLHSCKPPIVHRDLKSLNLLVDKDWNTKVADFGLSKATSGQSMNSRMGSLNWCAPEILLQSSSYSPEADSYSFGLVLWELVTHSVPYAGMSPLQIVKIKDTATMPALPNGVQKDYQQLIKDCCEPKPKHRPNFAQILDRLEALVRDGVTPYTKP